MHKVSIIFLVVSKSVTIAQFCFYRSGLILQSSLQSLLLNNIKLPITDLAFPSDPYIYLCLFLFNKKSSETSYIIQKIHMLETKRTS